MVYVLVSGTFEIIDTPHKGEVFGQRFDLSEDLAKSAVLSGAHLLPLENFESHGFDADDISAYPNARRQAIAPEDFKKKFAAAIQSSRDYRAQMAQEVKS